jgi:hypothetical protein
MKLFNNEEVDSWLFEHANIQGHTCSGIKGVISNGEEVNIAFIDEVTKESINLVWCCQYE